MREVIIDSKGILKLKDAFFYLAVAMTFPSVWPCTSTQMTFTWVYLDDMFYWISSDSASNITTAKCLCNEQPGARLAILDYSTNFDIISNFLFQNYGTERFWVDAYANGSLLSGSLEPSWSDGCLLAHGSEKWRSGEPNDKQLLNGGRCVILMADANFSSVKLATQPCTQASGRVLCQSVVPPVGFLSQRDNLTWQSFVSNNGTTTVLGLSASRVNYTLAKQSCSQQAGHFRLATLGMMFCEVMQYVSSLQLMQLNYWVDARRFITDADSLWSDGSAVDDLLWYPGEPGASDTHAYVSGAANSSLLGAQDYETHYYMCVGEPMLSSVEMLVEWVSLGNSSHLFGFSTVQLGFDDAKSACESLPGDVWLANLDKMFTDVTSYLKGKYQSRQYWVDARDQTLNGDFRWGNGLPVDTLFWAAGEPNQYESVAGLTAINRTVNLTGFFNTSGPLFFICQGNPASASKRSKFVAICNNTASTSSSKSSSGPTNIIVYNGSLMCKQNVSSSELSTFFLTKTNDTDENVTSNYTDMYVEASTKMDLDASEESITVFYTTQRMYGVNPSSSSPTYTDQSNHLNFTTASSSFYPASPTDMLALITTTSSDQSYQTFITASSLFYPASSTDMLALITTISSDQSYQTFMIAGSSFYPALSTDMLAPITMTSSDQSYQMFMTASSSFYPALSTDMLAPITTTSSDQSYQTFITASSSLDVNTSSIRTALTVVDSNALNETVINYSTDSFVTTSSEQSTAAINVVTPSGTSAILSQTAVSSVSSPTSTLLVSEVTTSTFHVCRCRSMAPALLNASAIKENIFKTKKYLYINSKYLSKYVRKLTSAKDKRVSAQATGFVGVFLMVVVGAAILFPDFLSLFYFFVECKRR